MPMSDFQAFEPIITVGGLIVVALITASSGVTIAMLARTNRNAKAIRVQTENDHESNLRDNIDTNQINVIRILGTISDTVSTVQNKQMQHDDMLAALFGITHIHQSFIDENTQEKEIQL